LSLQDVILRTTWNPAKVISRPELGNLDVGAEADVTVLKVREGEFGYTDVRRLTVDGTKKIEAELTIRAGRIVWDLNGLSTEKYQDLK
jgi:dihydroorotase